MSDLDDIRVYLTTNARDEYWADKEGGKADVDPFSWLAARLSEDLVARSVSEQIEDAAREERERFESWLRNAAPFMVSKCKTVRAVCDVLASYVARGVY